MKRISIIVFFLMLFYFNGFSQKIVFTPASDTVTFSAPLTNEAQSNESIIFIANNSNSPPNTIFWREISNVEDTDWQLGFCDTSQCFYYTSTVADANTNGLAQLDSGNSVRVDFTASPSCTAGTGELQILFWLTSDSAASARVLTFLPNYTGGCVSGIQQTNLPDYKIYPTPLTSELNIEGVGNLPVVKVTLYDIIGNTIMQNNYSSHGDIVTLNTSALHAGIYFVAIESSQRIVTRRVEKLN
jgi:hypothetical protein